MRKIILEDGKALTLAERNDQIYNKLKSTIKKQAQKEMESSSAKLGKFSAVVSSKLLEILRTYPLLTYEDVQVLTGADLQDYYVNFMELVNRIAEDLEFTPTKPLFCAYMGITTNIFNSFETNPDSSVRMWVDAINGDLTHSLMESSLHGNANTQVALAYAATKNYGQEIVRNDIGFEVNKKNVIAYTPKMAQEVTDRIAALIENVKHQPKTEDVQVDE